MKKIISFAIMLFTVNTITFAQKEKGEKGEKEGAEKITVPAAVKNSLTKKYPSATKVTWEKEKGNYEANWGGRSGEDNSVQFTPKGQFIEIVNAIPVNQLPALISAYVKQNYKGSKILEAGKVTDAAGKQTYEVEVNHKDLIFDLDGKFLKKEK